MGRVAHRSARRGPCLQTAGVGKVESGKDARLGAGAFPERQPAHKTVQRSEGNLAALEQPWAVAQGLTVAGKRGSRNPPRLNRKPTASNHVPDWKRERSVFNKEIIPSASLPRVDMPSVGMAVCKVPEADLRRTLGGAFHGSADCRILTRLEHKSECRSGFEKSWLV